MEPVTAIATGGLDLFGVLHLVLWHALRIGALVMVMPMFGGRTMPMQVRVMLTLVLAGALSGMLPEPPPAGFNGPTVLTVVRELVLGVAMGLIIRLAFEAGQLAGELMSQGMALSMATMADPASGTPSPILSMWFYLAFGLLFLAFDGHLAMVEMLVESYHALPIGEPMPDAMAVASAIPLFFATVLRAGVLLALPVMLALLTCNVSFGVLARAAQAFNPIALGLPVSLMVGLLLVGMVFLHLQEPILQVLMDAFAAARAIPGA